MPSTTLPPYFSRRDGVLHLEDCSLIDLAKLHGTPLFVYSRRAILEALAAYQQGLQGKSHLICYAMKANSNLAILQTLVEAGCGLDIVSGGELQRALAVGIDPAKIIFSGVGKTYAEMREALDAGIGCFNVESRSELDALDSIGRTMGVRAPVSIRVNPNVDAKTHPYISTGLRDNKFGISHEEVMATYHHAAQCAGLRVVGIDCHIGSQITEVSPYLDALERVLDLVQTIEASGIPIEHLDFGGGLGIIYRGDETPPAAYDLWRQILSRLEARGFGERKIVIEPGRSLVGNAGVCLTEVLYLKPGQHKNFMIVDAAMNDLPRPAMYQAYHRIEAVSDVVACANVTESKLWDVVGPVCESGDWIGRDRTIAAQQGDLLAVLSAGAYCMSMASNYNSRGRAAEVLVDGPHSYLIRARENPADLYRQERLVMKR